MHRENSSINCALLIEYEYYKYAKHITVLFEVCSAKLYSKIVCVLLCEELGTNRSYLYRLRTLETKLNKVELDKLKWRKITAENLDLDYTVLLPQSVATCLLRHLESEVKYFSGDLARVYVYGRWHPIPRQQVAFGDSGLSYKFSGNTVPAMAWPPALLHVRKILNELTGYDFNFVLVNRYRDGKDHIAEHRDDERELDPLVPIASLSLGQARDFIFKHRDARKRGPNKREVTPGTMTILLNLLAFEIATGARKSFINESTH
ncbi:DNA oxidative demethylase ALKBH2-like isoform X2 [Periplaneta americana]|uniref:DNA oxidative demethylase ALKBH2-like isoform X2 n=1 Tax=Periplaneta americana TaxID=6978 RepID=UPI0037E7E276